MKSSFAITFAIASVIKKSYEGQRKKRDQVAHFQHRQGYVERCRFHFFYASLIDKEFKQAELIVHGIIRKLVVWVHLLNDSILSKKNLSGNV